MDRKKLEKTRHELLVEMNDALNGELIAAMIREPEEKGMPEILTVVFDEMGLDNDEAVGELFFRPIVSDEDVVQHFTCMITLTQDLSEETLPALYEAVSYINFSLPCGCFAIDKDHQFLSYSLTVPLSVDMDREELSRQMNIVSANAVQLADEYMDLLIRLSDGEIDLNEIKDAM